MKAKFLLHLRSIAIIGSWVFSFMALSIDTCHSPLWAVLLVVAWFGVSSLLLIRADRKGWLCDICKRLKIDEL